MLECLLPFPVEAPQAKRASNGTPLEVLERLALQLGDAATAGDARALRERLDEGRFFVACLGQFKRGKSTLLNALIGRELLPMGVVPLTSVPTVLRFGSPSARVQLASGAWLDIEVARLEDYVSERGNPGNEKGVRWAEVFSDSALLASGLCLVDTPGIGSVIHANTEATHGFVPHIDAALVVVGVDPPLSFDELALVEELSCEVRHILIVLNKADRFSPTEREESRAFTQRALARRLGQELPVLEISALERVRRGPGGPDFEQLLAKLQKLSDPSDADLVRSAEKRGVAALVTRLRGELQLRREVLLRPITESEQKLEALRRATDDAVRGLSDLGALLRQEEQRLRVVLEAHRSRFLEDLTGPRAELRARAVELAGLPRRVLRAQLNEVAQRVARAHVEAWRTREQPEVDRLYQEAMSRFVALGNRFLERLAEATDDGTALFASVLEEVGLGSKSRLYFTDLMRLTSPSLLRRLQATLAPPDLARRTLLEDAQRYLFRLVETNSSRLQYDLDERVHESRERLERKLRARLEAAVAAGARALGSAKDALAQGSSAVEREQARLDGLQEQVDVVQPHFTEETS